jgi:hypothetical protein
LRRPAQERPSLLENFFQQQVVTSLQAQLEAVFPNLLYGASKISGLTVVHPQIRRHMRLLAGNSFRQLQKAMSGFHL